VRASPNRQHCCDSRQQQTLQSRFACRVDSGSHPNILCHQVVGHFAPKVVRFPRVCTLGAPSMVRSKIVAQQPYWLFSGDSRPKDRKDGSRTRRALSLRDCDKNRANQTRLRGGWRCKSEDCPSQHKCDLGPNLDVTCSPRTYSIVIRGYFEGGTRCLL
jgi:hypothetical protein